jgi:peroxiredoxin
VSADQPERLKKFIQGNGITFPLLIDADGAVIDRYGIRNLRATDHVLPDPTALVLDGEGRVRYKRIDVDYTVRPPAKDLVEAVRKLTPPATDRSG